MLATVIDMKTTISIPPVKAKYMITEIKNIAGHSKIIVVIDFNINIIVLRINAFTEYFGLNQKVSLFMPSLLLFISPESQAFSPIKKDDTIKL